MSGTLRALTPEDREAAWELGRLSFGGDREQAAPADGPHRGAVGIDDERGRLVARATLRSYSQWWGGRPVPMGGVAGVVVHPDARGAGLASRLVGGLLPLMRQQGMAVSALFPTAVAVYRPMGWEVVGSLDDTRVPTRDLRPAALPGPAAVRVRSAGPHDVPGVHALYSERGQQGSGLLTRTGPEFAAGPAAVLTHDVVALAEGVDGSLLGYASYDRGRGYGPDAALRLWELVARTAAGAQALLTSLATWDGVAPSVLWRGPTDEPALLLARPLPPPEQRRPWMLRIVDAQAAVAGRGFAPGARTAVSFALVDPQVASHEGAWRLVVEAGAGVLERVTGPVDLPALHVRGLALLYAGAADTRLLERVGLLDGALPGLDAAFAGPRPCLLDYF